MTNSTLQGDMRETFRSFHEDDHKARHPPPKTNEFCPAQRLPLPPARRGTAAVTTAAVTDPTAHDPPTPTPPWAGRVRRAVAAHPKSHCRDCHAPVRKVHCEQGWEARPQVVCSLEACLVSGLPPRSRPLPPLAPRPPSPPSLSSPTFPRSSSTYPSPRRHPPSKTIVGVHVRRVRGQSDAKTVCEIIAKDTAQRDAEAQQPKWLTVVADEVWLHPPSASTHAQPLPATAPTVPPPPSPSQPPPLHPPPPPTRHRCYH